MADDIPVDPARGDGNRHAHTRRVLRVVLVAGLAAAMLVFIYVLGDIFAPVFAALAYMLDPLVRRLERRGWPRRRAVIAIFAAAAFVIVALLAGSVPFLVRDVSYAVSAASAHLEEAGGEGGRPAEAGGDDFSSKFERSLRRSETMRRILDWAEEQHVMERASNIRARRYSMIASHRRSGVWPAVRLRSTHRRASPASFRETAANSLWITSSWALGSRSSISSAVRALVPYESN